MKKNALALRDVKAVDTEPVDKYLSEYRSFLLLAGAVISVRVEQKGSVTLTKVAEELRRTPAFWGLMKISKTWRVYSLLSTAYHFGAFKGWGFELRRGCGFTSRPRTNLRLIKGGRKP